MPAFENIGKSQTLINPNGDLSAAGSIFDEFCADRESIAALAVTDDELRELSRASLLGTLTCKEDLMFLLRHIRSASNSVAYPAHEESIPDVSAMTERMRLAALAKLEELDSKALRRSRSVWGRLMLAYALIKTMLNRSRRPPLVIDVSDKLGRRPVTSRSM
jgi:hypothetical protein